MFLLSCLIIIIILIRHFFLKSNIKVKKLSKLECKICGDPLDIDEYKKSKICDHCKISGLKKEDFK